MSYNIEDYTNGVQKEKSLYQYGFNFPEREILGYCQYGAFVELAKYAGIKKKNLHRNECEWQHGWHPKENNFDPEKVIGLGGDGRFNKSKMQLVARVDQEIYLRSQGFENVKAIGLPVVYIARDKIPRRSDAVLLVPCHGLGDSNPTENLIEWLRAAQRKIGNRQVFVLVHFDDFLNSKFLSIIESVGFKSIVGACYHDVNSLKRMAYIFSSFENILTNGFGSHLVYASYFGARISVIPPYTLAKKEELKRHIFYQNAPHLLDSIELDHGKMVEKICPFLLDNEGVVYQEWADKELGLDKKKLPSEIRNLMGWNWQGFAKNYLYRFTKKIGFA